MFELHMNENNLKIAEFLKASGKCSEVRHENDRIIVKFKFGFTIHRLHIGSIIKGFTDRDWRLLTNEIRRTISGARVCELSDLAIGIHPLKTELIRVRMDPLEKETLQEAAVLAGKSLSEFIRSAALKEASEVFDKKTVTKRRQSKGSQTYVQ